MNCARCGSPMTPGTGACPSCGLKIRQAPGASQAPTGASPQGSQTIPPSGPPEYAPAPPGQFPQPVNLGPGGTPHLPPASAHRAPPEAKSDSSRKMVYIIVGAMVLVLAVMGVLYFTVVKSPGTKFSPAEVKEQLSRPRTELDMKLAGAVGGEQDLNAVRQLLDEGANINAQDDLGLTVLDLAGMYTAVGGSPAMVDLLKTNGAVHGMKEPRPLNITPPQ